MCSFLQPLTLGQGLAHLSLTEVVQHLLLLLLVVALTRFPSIAMAQTGRLDKLNLVDGELK
jgi:hypothetical protein